jgi:peptidoglycan L-alanyl-D-glutamate endopeptidase CwlK
MPFKLSKKSKERRKGVDQRLIEISDLAIKITKVDFGHPEYAGMRTDDEQHELFKQGRSKADGYQKKSRHQTGLALDFYAFVDGKASWEKEHLAMVAAAFLQAASILGYQLEWGGLWRNFQDYPHIQLLEK